MLSINEISWANRAAKSMGKSEASHLHKMKNFATDDEVKHSIKHFKEKVVPDIAKDNPNMGKKVLRDYEAESTPRFQALKRLGKMKKAQMEKSHGEEISNLKSSHADELAKNNAEHASTVDKLKKYAAAKDDQVNYIKKVNRAVGEEHAEKMAAKDSEIADKTEQIAGLGKKVKKAIIGGVAGTAAAGTGGVAIGSKLSKSANIDNVKDVINQSTRLETPMSKAVKFLDDHPGKVAAAAGAAVAAGLGAKALIKKLRNKKK